MTTFCEFDECDQRGTEQRGPMFYCPEHAGQSDEIDRETALRCAHCSKPAQYTVGDKELCNDHASISCHNADVARPLTAAERKCCDFDECPARATTRRGALQLCAQHGAEHDEMEAECAREDAVAAWRGVATQTLIEVCGSAHDPDLRAKVTVELLRRQSALNTALAAGDAKAAAAIALGLR